jgi:hypothetical protein
LRIEDPDDSNHKAAIEYRDRICAAETPFRSLYTSNYAVDETLTVLRTRCGHRAAVSFRKVLQASRLLKVLWITESLEKAAWEIFEKRADKEFSFTDCTSFAIMEAEAIRSVFTFDKHFSEYGFEPVP